MSWRDRENPFKDVKEVTIPVKIKLYFSGGAAGSWDYEIIFPTMGIQKCISAREEQKVRDLLAFLGDPCTSPCSKCKHWGYYLTCYKLKNWEAERDKK